MPNLAQKARMTLPGCLASQRGVSLLVVLMVVASVALLMLSVAQSSQHNERSARNERDRAIATAAAEAALADARLDIALGTRSTFLRCNAQSAFSSSACGQGNSGATSQLGLCGLGTGDKPAWLALDLSKPDDANTQTRSVPVGTFTSSVGGVPRATTTGLQPRAPARYIIEAMPNNTGSWDYLDETGIQQTASAPLYRITAVGYGPGDNSHVIMQALYVPAKGTALLSSAPSTQTGSAYQYSEFQTNVCPAQSP